METMRPGTLVTPIVLRVDLCTDVSLTREVCHLGRTDIGMVLGVGEFTHDLEGDQFVRVLSPSGSSGWCLSRFLRIPNDPR